MFELVGALDHVELDFTLWAVVVAPWLGMLACLRAVLSDGEARKSAEALARTAALVSAAIALGVAVYACGRLLLIEEKPALLLCHLWTLVRIASLNIELTLLLDVVSGAALCAVTLMGLVFVVLHRENADLRVLGAGLGALGAAALGILSDDVVMAVTGFALTHSALALAVLFSRQGRGALRAGFVPARVLEVAALAASGVVFWGLAGSWAPGGDFTVDFRARIVGVQDPAGANKPAKHTQVRDANGTIEMTSRGGSAVHVGTAQVCEIDADGRPGGVGLPSRPCKREARAPFANLSFPAALHDLTVSSGPGSYDSRAEKIRVYSETRTVIASTGPTLSAKAVTDQLRLKDASGAYVHRAGLSSRRLGGLYATTWVAMLLFASVLGAALSGSREEEADETSAAGLSVLSTTAVAVFLHRFDYVFAMNARAAAWIALAAAGLCALFALRASFATGARSLMVDASAAALAATLVGVAAGAGARAALFAVVTNLGLCALAFATGAWSLGGQERLVDRRAAYAAAAIAAGAPVPLLGAFFPRDALLRAGAAFSAGSAPAWLVAGLTALALGVLSFSIWRFAYLASKSEEPTPASAARGSWSLGLSVTGILLGILAVGGPIIGEAASAISGLFRPAAVEAAGERLSGDVQLVWSAVAFAPAFFGFLFAKRRYSRADFKETEKTRPLRALFAEKETPSGQRSVLASLGASIVRMEGAWFFPALAVDSEGPASSDASVDSEPERPPVESKKRVKARKPRKKQS